MAAAATRLCRLKTMASLAASKWLWLAVVEKILRLWRPLGRRGVSAGQPMKLAGGKLSAFYGFYGGLASMWP